MICGLPYVWLAARQPSPVEPLAAPVLAGDRYAGRPVYDSDVIVRRDSPVRRLEELRGCSWAYKEPASHSGHTATLYSLVRVGARPGFLGRVVAASRLPGPLKDQVRDVPVSLGDAPTARTTLAHGFIQGFARVDDAAYDDMREMLATIEAAGWTSLTQPTAE